VIAIISEAGAKSVRRQVFRKREPPPQSHRLCFRCIHYPYRGHPKIERSPQERCSTLATMARRKGVSLRTKPIPELLPYASPYCGVGRGAAFGSLLGTFMYLT
jgi:hypothetical protein